MIIQHYQSVGGALAIGDTFRQGSQVRQVAVLINASSEMVEREENTDRNNPEKADGKENICGALEPSAK